MSISKPRSALCSSRSAFLWPCALAAILLGSSSAAAAGAPVRALASPSDVVDARVASAEGEGLALGAGGAELALDPSLFPFASARPRVAGRGGGGGGYGGGNASPQGRSFGIGVQLGLPIALTIKYMVASDQGIVGTLGIFQGFPYFYPGISISGDYVWHPHVIALAPPFRLSWFIGGGLGVGFYYDYYGPGYYRNFGYVYFNGYGPSYVSIPISARLPLGLNLAFTAVPIELYVELVPQLLIFPYIGPGVGADIGFRFYF